MRAAVTFVFAVGMPLTFVGVTGVKTTAAAWLLDLTLLGSVLLVVPLSARSVRAFAPYLGFLALGLLSLLWAPDFGKGLQTLLQLTVPATAYLVAWRIREPDLLLHRLTKISIVALGLILALALAGTAAAQGLALSVRPAAISLSVVFVVATITAPSWRRTAVVGGCAIFITALTGSRTATAVLGILLLCSPSLRIGARWRVGIAGGLAGLLVLASQTPEFKQRFFFNSDASLVDVLTISDSLNTSGRRELWPQLTRACSSSPLLGQGLGSGSVLALELSHGVIAHPHNDYLRTYCDTGLVGSTLFWGFFLYVGLRGVRRSRLEAARRELQTAAALLVLSFMVLAVTDNLMIYTAQFMTPLAVVLGLADAAWARRGGPPRGRNGQVPAPGTSGPSAAAVEAARA